MEYLIFFKIYQYRRGTAIRDLIVIECSKLDVNIRKSLSYGLFKKCIWSFLRPNILNVHVPEGTVLLTRLWPRLSHLKLDSLPKKFLLAL